MKHREEEKGRKSREKDKRFDRGFKMTPVGGDRERERRRGAKTKRKERII